MQHKYEILLRDPAFIEGLKNNFTVPQLMAACKHIEAGGTTFKRARQEAFRRGLAATPPDSLPEIFQTTAFESDKREGVVNWRELCRVAEQVRAVVSRASWSQDQATVSFPEKKEIAIIALADFHYGSRGADHSLIERITDEILSIPDLYVVVLGDMEHLAIKLRGVLEVSDNLLPPKLQHDFTESWLEEIGHRILCATWDNHSVMREETQSGTSLYARIMSRKVIYHNGIGHIDIEVGAERYALAVSHFFRGRSYLHALHSQKRYMRFEGQDREIAIAGDSHVPAMEKYIDGEKTRLAVNVGSTQVDSGYARRHFSLKTHPVYPVIILSGETHEFTPYWSIAEYLRAKGLT